MKLTSPLLLRLLTLCVGLWFAFPAFGQETDEESTEEAARLDNCSAEKCCEQAAPIRALILTIARCTADPDPTPGTCETLPQTPLPKSVLSCVFQFEAAKNTHQNSHPGGFYEASRSEHQPVPSSQNTLSPDDRVLSSSVLPALPLPMFVYITLPKLTTEAILLPGFHTLPETPG
jgi:hypothetical protein